MNMSYRDLVTSCMRDIVTSCLKPGKYQLIDCTQNFKKLRKELDNFLILYPDPVPYYIVAKINMILQSELAVKTIILPCIFPRLHRNCRMSIWQGDISIIRADCIVNPLDSSGLGCFNPYHNCIDNLLRCKAGPQLRSECAQKIANRTIKSGDMFTTLAYNLPYRYIFHVRGPIYDQVNRNTHEIVLAGCYINCLEKMKEMCLHSIVFCPISTNELKYPTPEATVVAFNAVNRWLEENAELDLHVIFCVCEDSDRMIYEEVSESCLW